MPLYRLVFISIIAPTHLDEPEATVEAIFAQARLTNPSLEVTGAIIHADHYFAQVLEGRRRVVSDLYSRIARDPRHVAPQLVSVGPTGERRFGAWYDARPTRATMPTFRECFARFGPSTHFVPGEMPPSKLIQLIWVLAEAGPAPRPPLTDIEELAWDDQFVVPEPEAEPAR